MAIAIVEQDLFNHKAKTGKPIVHIADLHFVTYNVVIKNCKQVWEHSSKRCYLNLTEEAYVLPVCD